MNIAMRFYCIISRYFVRRFPKKSFQFLAKKNSISHERCKTIRKHKRKHFLNFHIISFSPLDIIVPLKMCLLLFSFEFLSFSIFPFALCNKRRKKGMCSILMSVHFYLTQKEHFVSEDSFEMDSETFAEMSRFICSI